MLFNSYIFILLFLPVSILFFYFIGKYKLHKIAITWLVAVSLFFYGWWNPKFLLLLLVSIAFNYIIGYILSKLASGQNMRSKVVLIIGIMGNLSLLAYYKYAYFVVANISHVIGTPIRLSEIVLPLGISFFTFTQIAYLIDVYKEHTKEYSFISYILFVTFFPHLIAGPILHHKEMMPQFADKRILRINWQNITVGLVIFILGLFKKVIIADALALIADPIFNLAASRASVTFVESWVGALGYSLQLYFDFSAYSDMAIGLALLFNIKLPINFLSPYKSASIIEFWQRWHMTLSRYLRDYLYIPLGGNRRGTLRKYINLIITMTIGGLWHGAGWTFVLWGGLHGLYLTINHFWRWLKDITGIGKFRGTWYTKAASWLLTFTAVVVSWVIFRATDLRAVSQMIKGMFGFNGLSVDPFLTQYRVFKYFGFQNLGFMPNANLPIRSTLFWIAGSLLIAILAPNVMEITAKYKPAINISKHKIKSPVRRYLEWRPSIAWALIIGIIASFTFLGLTKVSQFLYFQF